MAKHHYKTTEAHRAKSKRWYEAHKQHCAERNRQYYLEHRDERNAYKKEWMRKYPDKQNAYKREWKRKRREQDAIECPLKHKQRLTPEEALERKRQRERQRRAEHPDAAARNSKRWRAENPPDLATRELAAARARAWRAANLERAVQRQREWKKNNPEKIREYNRNRKVRLSSKDGRHAAEDIEALYQLQEGQCAGCNALLQKSGPGRFHVDHIVPLFPKDGRPAGTNKPENLQLLCRRCNLSKSNLSQEQWDRREGRLLSPGPD